MKDRYLCVRPWCSIQDATSADVDVELNLVGTTSESLRVTGTIRCSAPVVTE
ncbi:MAG: hypothetical protein WD795_17640 [Woeseia sp.]